MSEAVDDEVEITEMPLPTPMAKRDEPSSKYIKALMKMRVGQCFTVGTDKEKDKARGAAMRVKKKLGRDFTMRKVDDDLWRIWRTQ